MAGDSEKKFLAKRIPVQKRLRRTPPPPTLQTTPLANGIYRLKHFRSKRLTTGPDEKSVSSIERSKSGGEAVCLSLFCLFVLYLSINVNFIYLLMKILSIYE